MADKPARGHLSEREQHEIVAEALAAIRLYHRFYASANPTSDRITEIVTILRAAGRPHDMGKHGSILTTAADAISRAYLNTPADDLTM